MDGGGCILYKQEMGNDSVELVLAFEDEFGVTIPDRVAATLETPDDAVTVIWDILVEDGRPQERSKIEKRVEKVTVEVLGISRNEFRLDGSFADDYELG